MLVPQGLQNIVAAPTLMTCRVHASEQGQHTCIRVHLCLARSMKASPADGIAVTDVNTKPSCSSSHASCNVAARLSVPQMKREKIGKEGWNGLQLSNVLDPPACTSALPPQNMPSARPLHDHQGLTKAPKPSSHLIPSHLNSTQGTCKLRLETFE